MIPLSRSGLNNQTEVQYDEEEHINSDNDDDDDDYKNDGKDNIKNCAINIVNITLQDFETLKKNYFEIYKIFKKYFDITY